MADDVTDSEVQGAASLLFELGVLKRTPRTGWLDAGVPSPESIADHSFRVSALATVLAAMEGADPNRAATMATWHDSQETRTGDISHLGRNYVTAVTNQAVTADQVGSAPSAVAEFVTAAIAEYETQETLEAQVARDADKLEALLTAVEYHRAGSQNVGAWIDSSRAALKTSSAQRIADAAITMTTLEWRGL